MDIEEIRLSEIKVSEFNTRKDLKAGTEDTGLDDLADSIRDKGLLNPITVRKLGDGTYSLIAGQRRYLACQKLGFESIPVIVRELEDDTDAVVISLIENVQRADMNPMDKARAFQKIHEKYEDYNKVARETGLSAATVKRYLSLLNLAPAIQETVSTTDGHAGIGTLSKLAEKFAPEQQGKVLESIRGFAQPIQTKMLSRSGGDIDKMEELREEALGGAFNTFMCRSLEGCQFIPEELIEPVKAMIEKFEKTRS